MRYVQEWGEAFAATLVLEALLIFPLCRTCRVREVLIAFLTANCSSHPFLWFVYPLFEPYSLWVTTAEITIVAYEALVYRALLRPCLSLSRAVAVSLVANSVSCLVGLLT